MHVYFLKAGNHIKIGCADNPLLRMRGIQTGNPHKLEIIGVMSGNFQLEKELHERFADLQVNGEWFQSGEELMEFIDEYADDFREDEWAGDSDSGHPRDNPLFFEVPVPTPEALVWLTDKIKNCRGMEKNTAVSFRVGKDNLMVGCLPDGEADNG